jgi:hypothetical protein
MIADARCSNRLLEPAHALSPLTTWLRTPRVAQPALPALPPKRRAVGGVSLRVALKDPFTSGGAGSAALTVHKDRHGGLSRVCPTPQGGEA